MKPTTVTSTTSPEFKFFLSVAKSATKTKKILIEGIASGTLEDLDSERMSRQVLEQFASAIKSASLPLTDNHMQGSILTEVGTVVDAKVLDDSNNSLWVKAELDADHPATPVLIRKLEEGKKFAFSIEGLLARVEQVFSEKLGRYIKEYASIVPKAVSITSQPAYSPSFINIISKAYKKTMDLTESNQERINNLYITPTLMKEETKSTETVEQTETVEIEEVAQPETEASTEVEQPTEPVLEEVEKEVEKSTSLEAMVKSLSVQVQALAERMNVQPIEPVVEKSSDVIESKLDLIASKLGELENVHKSFHDEMEELKKLPLAKKSVATIPSKGFAERAGTSELSFADAYKQLVTQ